MMSGRPMPKGRPLAVLVVHGRLLLVGFGFVDEGPELAITPGPRRWMR